MFENCLLNATAITAVVNTISGFRTEPVAETEVTALLESRLRDTSYYCASKEIGSLPNRDAVRFVDGARILLEIFRELSEERDRYDKVRHGIVLTEWMVSNAPGDLKELADLLAHVLTVEQPKAM